MKKRQMYFRMITASLLRRRSRMIIALLAITIGATILSGLVTIYIDVPRQMRAQFRNYGANMIFTAEGEAMTAEQVNEAIAVIPTVKLVGAAPYSYKTVRINDRPVMAAATDMEGAAKTSPFWSVDGEWPAQSGEIMVGKNVASTSGLKPGKRVTCTYAPDVEGDSTGEDASQETSGDTAGQDASQETSGDTAGQDTSEETSEEDAAEQNGAAEDSQGQELTEEDIVLDNYKDFTVTGILDTGGKEEEYVYMVLDDLKELTGEETTYDICELSISADSSELSSYAGDISENVDGVSARLVKRVTESETTVLTKLQALVLLVTVVVLALTMICVATTMTAVVAERRKEIGLRKAMGASNGSIVAEFMGEGLVLGAAGGIAGALLGFVFAQAVSMNVFNSSITLMPWLIPVTMIASVIVTGLACMIPIRSATEVDPALVLKGE